METIGKAYKTKSGWKFKKEYFGQGTIYKYMDDLAKIDDDFPIYSGEYDENDYETKRSLQEMCKGSCVNWELLFEVLDWSTAESAFLEMNETCEMQKSLGERVFERFGYQWDTSWDELEAENPITIVRTLVELEENTRKVLDVVEEEMKKTW